MFKFFLNQKGLSMIEIIVAFGIISVTFIALSQSFPLGLSINKSAESKSIAFYLTQDKIEEIYSLGYDGFSAGTIEAKHRLSSDPDNYLYYYQRQTDVIYVDSDLNESMSDLGIKKVTSTVYYEDAITRSEQDYSISFLINEN